VAEHTTGVGVCALNRKGINAQNDEKTKAARLSSCARCRTRLSTITRFLVVHNRSSSRQLGYPETVIELVA